MNELEALATMAALLALWCLAPLTIVLVFGRQMNRLLDRWQASEEAAKDELMPDRADWSDEERKDPFEAGSVA